MKTVARVTLHLPEESWARLEVLRQQTGGSVEDLVSNAFRIYEFAFGEANKAALRGGRLHLAVQLPDGTVELGEGVFGPPETLN